MLEAVSSLIHSAKNTGTNPTMLDDRWARLLLSENFFLKGYLECTQLERVRRYVDLPTVRHVSTSIDKCQQVPPSVGKCRQVSASFTDRSTNIGKHVPPF